jgi:multiple sugar transport system substrate-binding protein
VRARSTSSAFRRTSAAFAFALTMCGCRPTTGPPDLTISGSSVGREAELLRSQLARFEASHPPLRVAVRATPDASDDRHQLYVQWLNARATDPDVLQLDVVWTAEFAAAGWILNLDRFHPDQADFFPSALAAATWNSREYARPWFVDVGMLYWRTDLMDRPPQTFDALNRLAARAVESGAVPYGLVWQGARYEGLVTVFLEYLSAFGGAILDERGRVVVDSDAAIRAATAMRDEIASFHIVPPAVLSWQEEQTRFAFQNGQAAFMRNWPYAYTLLEARGESQVAGHFGVTSMPAGEGGTPTAALGGSNLAINANSDRPDAAYALVDYLTQPEQMIERARAVGQFPARERLYENGTLAGALEIEPATAHQIISHAVPRPVTPVYAELSEILQVHLHRVLSRQEDPRDGLLAAAAAMRQILERSGLGGGA